MKEENSVPRADPDKSSGELTEGRTHPTPDIGAGDYPPNRTKPEQRKADGLRGHDKQQASLRDQSSNQQEPVRREPAEIERSPRHEPQPGADVRNNKPVVQRTDPIESLPEGLRRERKGPYDKYIGRNEAASHVPSWTGKP